MSWAERLAAAEARDAKGLEPFNRRDREDSGHWTTCACCELDVKKFDSAVPCIPEDDIIHAAGHRFHTAVNNQDVQRARQEFDRMHARAKEIANAAS